MFSPNTIETKKQAILLVANGILCACFDKYLDLPVLVGKKKHLTFKWLKDRIWQKLNNWKNNFLSQVGKEVLIKAVLKAIPIYTMSLYQLPKSLC